MGGFKIMKTVLLAGAFLLSSSFLVAQNQSPASTPPTLPQSQSQPAPDQQPSSSPSSTMPSADQSAQAGSQSDSSAQKIDSSAQKIEGCLSQTASGFALADASGTTYNLTGDTSKLSSHVGEQVEVKGTPASGSAASSAAPSADSSAASAGASGAASAAGQSFTVQSVKKIAKSCANAQPKQ
jgi:hypothetical protein